MRPEYFLLLFQTQAKKSRNKTGDHRMEKCRHRFEGKEKKLDNER
jgi:hypothetical protein